MEQTLHQTLNLTVGNPTAPDTGFALSLSSFFANPWLIVLGATVLATVLLLLAAATRKPATAGLGLSYSLMRLPRRSIAATAVAIGLVLSIAFYATNATADTPVTLTADTETITIDLTKTGGTKTTNTSVTAATASTTGYTLTAGLENPEPGITVTLTGGDLPTTPETTLTTTPVTIKTTDVATSGSGDTTPLTLTVTADGSATPGQKQLRIVYVATANPTAPQVLTMQTFTASQCSALDTYTGSNEDAVLTLHDPRGAGQDYQVAKLADSNCWMLDNLKLGSTTDTLTLTPSDSNVASNFTLPQLVTTGTADYDNPGAYGPVPGDTGSGATNYGYLYNWPAATAGESRTSHTETDGDAPYSICAAGWRLPTGGTYDSGEGEFAALDIAFGGTGMGVWDGEPNIALWQHDGPFKGVLSGNWWSGFFGQGVWGYLWSASAYPDWPGGALSADFRADEVYPGDGYYRSYGLSVRCLLH